MDTKPTHLFALRDAVWDILNSHICTQSLPSVEPVRVSPVLCGELVPTTATPLLAISITALYPSLLLGQTAELARERQLWVAGKVRGECVPEGRHG